MPVGPVRLSPLTTARPNPDVGQTAGRVFALRGQLAVFSRGFGRLCDRLRDRGCSAEDLRCVGDAWAVRQLIAARDAGLPQMPVVFIGHSRGGRRSLVAAQTLERHGVAVDLVVCVDVALPPLVPANVRHAVHVFRGRRRLYPVRPIQRITPSTLVENIDLDAPDAPFPGRGLTHLTITAHAPLLDWLTTLIGETTRRRLVQPLKSAPPASR